MAHPVVLSDASPLIALALIDRLNLLHSLFGEVLITEVVKGEVLVGGDKSGETAIAVTDRRIGARDDRRNDASF